MRKEIGKLFPDTFVGVCMLPQSPKADLAASVRELRRCVEQLGFIGCNLNPDPGGGHFDHPPLTDEYWFPIYEAMCELDVPAMIHVSGSCNPAMQTCWLSGKSSLRSQCLTVSRSTTA